MKKNKISSVSLVIIVNLVLFFQIKPLFGEENTPLEEPQEKEEVQSPSSVEDLPIPLPPPLLLVSPFIESPAQYQDIPSNRVEMGVFGVTLNYQERGENFDLQTTVDGYGGAVTGLIKLPYIPATLVLIGSKTSFNARATHTKYWQEGDLDFEKLSKVTSKGDNLTITPAISLALSERIRFGLSYDRNYSKTDLKKNGLNESDKNSYHQFTGALLYRENQFELGLSFLNAVSKNPNPEQDIDDIDEPATTKIHGRLQVGSMITIFGKIEYLFWDGVDRNNTLINQLNVSPGMSVALDEENDLLVNYEMESPHYRKEEYRSIDNLGTISVSGAYVHHYAHNSYVGALALINVLDETVSHEDKDNFNLVTVSLSVMGGISF